VGGPENGALTGINEDLGWPPYPVQLNNPEDEDRDGLQNVGLQKTEPPYLADSPKKLHHAHLLGKHQIVIENTFAQQLVHNLEKMEYKSLHCV
jgi:hypothetical protein